MVAKFDLAKKYVAPNSPIEIAKLNKPATMIPGRRIGSSIFKKVLTREAPRLRATFIIVGSIFARVAAIMRLAKGKAISV